MIVSIHKEIHSCVQGSGQFDCYIILINNKRYFATEDYEYLINSPSLFDTEGNVTMILEWDRNSMELPELGPPMDADIEGELFLMRNGQDLLIQHGNRQSKKTIVTIPLEEWVTAIDKLQKQNL